MLTTYVRTAVSALGFAAATLPGPSHAEKHDRTTLSFYGPPGLIETPTADALPDGTLAFTTSHFGATLRNTLTFQITPRLSGSFRYSVIDAFNYGGTEDRLDRSFDLTFRLQDEGTIRPAISIGLRDFIGSGIYSSEYVVASKSIGDRLRISGGIGWGRLGSKNGFANPFGHIWGGFNTRRPFQDGVNNGGEIEANQWFRGDAALFGGVELRATDRLTVLAEYSSDAYVPETDRGLAAHRSPFNFGVNYRMSDRLTLGAYYLYGTDIGLSLSYNLNPKHARLPSGHEAAPPPVIAGGSRQAARGDKLRDNVSSGLAGQHLQLDSLTLEGREVTARVQNAHYDAAPQAIGRAARVLANSLPPSVENFTIVPVENGLPLSAIRLQRSDLEALEFAPDGAWQSYVRADIFDAYPLRSSTTDFTTGAYPKLDFGLRGYVAPSLFDPDSPIRADLGAELSLRYSPAPGILLSGALRQPIIGNLDDVTRVSNSVLPHVRSDAARYDAESDLAIPYLTAAYFFRPAPNLYGRVTAGWLERMYGGLSAELLWKPVDSRIAYGAELNYAKQRDFDGGFGFRDYDIVTGHGSIYYEMGNGFHAQIDAGRYLAGDWGATLTLDREFDNGWRIGGFLTLTDVPFDDFGEGSFDKGIRIQVPLSWLTGEPSRRGFATTIRPVTRDGGARLNVNNRLYELTRGYHDPRLNARWGRFWR